jgi:hypothetical protein
MSEKFLQRANESMERRGTKGSFGKATPEKIKAGLKAGGARARKAAFAKAAVTIARHRRERSKA